MARYLLDASVVAEMHRHRPNPGVLAWFEGARHDDLYVSVLTVGEIRAGIGRLRARDPRQAAGIEQWLGQLETGYADRLLPVTAAVAERWAELNAARLLPVVDGLLVATASVHDAALVTGDTIELADVGVRLLNPFTPTRRTLPREPISSGGRFRTDPGRHRARPPYGACALDDAQDVGTGRDDHDVVPERLREVRDRAGRG